MGGAMIELTQDQTLAVKNGEAVRVPAPEIGEDVVLLRLASFEKLQELAQADREERAVLAYSMKQAARVAAENPY